MATKSTSRASSGASPWAMLSSIVANRGLIGSLVRREVAGRYRGSALGLIWSVATPLVMLAVYTFVFGSVFKTRWEGGDGSYAEFALMLFAGLTVFNFFSECINRAPSLIQQNTNFVKKVVFPLEVLPVVTMGSALFHFGISLGVWGAFYVIAYGMPHGTALILPIVLVPLLLITIGITWTVASLGVYLRDVAQLVGVVLMILMFLSPVFYPAERLGTDSRFVLYLSPVTVTIEQVREVLMEGAWPDLWTYALFSLVAALVAWLGFVFFQRTRKGFADVL